MLSLVIFIMITLTKVVWFMNYDVDIDNSNDFEQSSFRKILTQMKRKIKPPRSKDLEK